MEILVIVMAIRSLLEAEHMSKKQGDKERMWNGAKEDQILVIINFILLLRYK